MKIKITSRTAGRSRIYEDVSDLDIEVHLGEYGRSNEDTPVYFKYLGDDSLCRSHGQSLMNIEKIEITFEQSDDVWTPLMKGD